MIHRNPWVWLGMLGIGLLAVSCVGNKTEPTPANDTLTNSPSDQPPPLSQAQPKPTKNEDDQQIVVPPGANCTIYCAAYHGEGAVNRAKKLMAQLAQRSGRQGFYIVRKEVATTVRVANTGPNALLGEMHDQATVVTEADVCFGFYTTEDHTTPEGQRARADKQAIAALLDAVGERMPIFPCILVLDPPDPEAPPEWNLVNKDKDKPDSDLSKAFWSLEIGASVGSYDRKQKAVDAVRAAREAGIEAYYYHGQSVSSICIGAWPRSAIKEADAKEAKTQNSEQTILVIDRELPKNMSRIIGPDGRPMAAFTVHAEIADQTLRQMMLNYPAHVVNGYETKRTATDPVTHKIVMVPDPSFLVIIPRQEVVNSRYRSMVQGEAPADTGGQSRGLIDQMQNPDPSAGPQNTGSSSEHRLRSIGD